MRLLLLSLFAVVALSPCHLVVHDVIYHPAPRVVQPVQVVHCHYATPRCRMHEERPRRKRRAISILGKRPAPMGPFAAAAPPKKRYQG